MRGLFQPSESPLVMFAASGVACYQVGFARPTAGERRGGIRASAMPAHFQKAFDRKLFHLRFSLQGVSHILKENNAIDANGDVAMSCNIHTANTRL